MPRRRYDRVKVDAVKLRQFLEPYAPEAKGVSDYRLSEGVTVLVRETAKLLCMLPLVPCSCPQKFDGHPPYCNRIKAIQFEQLFFDRWGITRHSTDVSPQLKELANEQASTVRHDRGVIPLIRAAAG